MADCTKTKKGVIRILEAVISTSIKDNNPAILLSIIEDISHSNGMGKLLKNVNHTQERICDIISQDDYPTFGTALRVLEDMGFELFIRHKP